MRNRQRTSRGTLILGVLVLVLAACGTEGGDATTTEAPGTTAAPGTTVDSGTTVTTSGGLETDDAAQQVARTEGDNCVYTDYNGGLEHVDLQNALIGFAQSETRGKPVPYRGNRVDQG